MVAVPQAGVALDVDAESQHQDRSAAITGAEMSSDPHRLQVMYLPEQQYLRVCNNRTAMGAAVVVHCQAHNSGAAKVAFLRKTGLWRDVEEQTET